MLNRASCHPRCARHAVLDLEDVAWQRGLGPVPATACRCRDGSVGRQPETISIPEGDPKPPSASGPQREHSRDLHTPGIPCFPEGIRVPQPMLRSSSSLMSIPIDFRPKQSPTEWVS